MRDGRSGRRAAGRVLIRRGGSPICAGTSSARVPGARAPARCASPVWRRRSTAVPRTASGAASAPTSANSSPARSSPAGRPRRALAARTRRMRCPGPDPLPPGRARVRLSHACPVREPCLAAVPRSGAARTRRTPDPGLDHPAVTAGEMTLRATVPPDKERDRRTLGPSRRQPGPRRGPSMPAGRHRSRAVSCRRRVIPLPG